MLEAISLLLLFQLLGEALTHLFGLPLPGPVIGMAALFLAWPWLSRVHDGVERLATGLLSHLGLLFVPAGVGVMLHWGLLASWWGPLLLGLVSSTLLTMAVAAWVFSRWRRGAAEPPP